MEFHLKNTVFPAFDEISTMQMVHEEPDEEDIEELTKGYSDPSSSRRHSKRSTRSRHQRDFASSIISDGLRKVVNNISELLTKAAELCEIRTLSNDLLTLLSHCIVSVFGIDRLEQLQIKSVEFLRTLYSHYPKHRENILSDVLQSLSKLSRSKNPPRLYA